MFYLERTEIVLSNNDNCSLIFSSFEHMHTLMIFKKKQVDDLIPFW